MIERAALGAARVFARRAGFKNVQGQKGSQKSGRYSDDSTVKCCDPDGLLENRLRAFGPKCA